MLNISTQAYVSNCTFTNNTAKDDKVPGAAGGGIAWWPQIEGNTVGLAVSDCIFNENEAEIDGGGIWIQSFGELTNENDQPLMLVQLNRETVGRSSVSPLLGGGEEEIGACCILGNCAVVTEEVCLQVGGTYQGDGTSCETSNCDLLGACCLLDQPCMTVLEDECNNAGGIWQGKSSWCPETCCYCSGTFVSDTDFYCNLPTDIDGDYTDNGGNTFADECPSDCPDINGDGYINITDVLAVIDQWGLTDSPADVTGDGIVDVSDLLIVLGNWGPCE